MPILDEFANEFAIRLINASNKAEESRNIAKELNCIVYTKNNQPVSQEYKQDVVNRTLQIIKENFGIKDSDIQVYRELINFILTLIEEEKGISTKNIQI